MKNQILVQTHYCQMHNLHKHVLPCQKPNHFDENDEDFVLQLEKVMKLETTARCIKTR